MEISILASGSSGNCIYLASGDTRILIDAGLSLREIGRRLALAGGDLARLDAVCVTHEHLDHCRGLRTMHRRFGLPVFINEPTANALERIHGYDDMVWTIFRSDEPFPLGDLAIEPIGVSHDASEPVGFIVTDQAGLSVGVVTDLGVVTESLRERLRICDAIILEFNHDPDRLRGSTRPWPVKQRIAGLQGHLSNEAASALLADLAGGRLRTAFLAHLSKDCNAPELIMGELGRVFRARNLPLPDLRLTYRDRISDRLLLE